MPEEKKVYFLSDLHLGTNGKLSSEDREKKVCAWLRSIKDKIDHLYLVGDVFDYWYEYKEVVPKGYMRWFGLLAELRDANIPITAFTGNHDLWMFNYLTDMLGIPVVRQPITVQHFDYTLLLAHGDGLGPGDRGYKLLKKVFTNTWCQWLFSRLHPNFALWIMRKSSFSSRKYGANDDYFMGSDKEWLVQYCEKKILSNDYDYMVFGHRHLPIWYTLSNGHSVYVNLGDWLYYETYATLGREGMELHYLEQPQGKIYG